MPYFTATFKRSLSITIENSKNRIFSLHYNKGRKVGGWVQRVGQGCIAVAMACWTVDLKGTFIPKGNPSEWNNYEIKAMFPVLKGGLGGSNTTTQEKTYISLSQCNICML